MAVGVLRVQPASFRLEAKHTDSFCCGFYTSAESYTSLLTFFHLDTLDPSFHGRTTFSTGACSHNHMHRNPLSTYLTTYLTSCLPSLFAPVHPCPDNSRPKVTPLLGEGGVYDDFEISSELDDAVSIKGAANVPVCLTMSRVRLERRISFTSS